MIQSFRIGEYIFEWNGQHTVSIRDTLSPRAFDVFSLNYERDDYTLDEVKAHAIEWFKYMEDTNV
jgi:uncharacterized protein YkuJ